jgi:FAD/FMN-containing dehydrogenase
MHCRSSIRRRILSTKMSSSAPVPAALYLKDLQRIVGNDHVVHADSSDSLDKYVIDWTRKYRGVDNVVAFPRSTAEVSELLAFCNSKLIAVIPQGGNTGLVGGAVGGAGGGELILSLEKMNAIIEFDADEAVLVAEAGCILETLSNTAAEKGFLVPLDLGSKGGCMIGGNVSTNAGGLRVIRYGNLHQNVLGLEVVQADGTVLDMLRHLPKDNCGYPLKHLFIGAEGTLGVVTKVAIALAPLPANTAVALVKVSSFDAVGWLLRETQKSALSTNLSAFEFMDASSLSCMAKACAGVLGKVGAPSVMTLTAGVPTPQDGRRGIAGEMLVLMEFSSGGSEGNVESATTSAGAGTAGTASPDESASPPLKDSLEQFLANLFSDEGDATRPVAVLDAVVSQSRGQELALWGVREHLPVGLMQLSRSALTAATAQLFKYDVSMKLSVMDSVVLTIKTQLQREGYHIADDADVLLGERDDPCSLLFCNFGHAGDKNLHLNVIAVVRHANTAAAPAATSSSTATTTTSAAVAATATAVTTGGAACFEGVRVALDRAVYKAVLSVSGSISAEHGVGQKNRAAMPAVRSAAELRLMAAIKRTLDPNNTLNPRKVIPDGY